MEKNCLKCGGLIVTGRSDKVFCSDLCRNKYNYKNGRINNLFATTKKRALERNIPFNITIEDIQIPEYCPVFGFKLNIGDGHQTNESPSIDKFIPELGYIKGNVWIISMKANRLKSNLTRSELKTFCEVMLSKLNSIDI